MLASRTLRLAATGTARGRVQRAVRSWRWDVQANLVPQRALKLGFAALMLVVAAQFLRRWHQTARAPRK